MTSLFLVFSASKSHFLSKNFEERQSCTFYRNYELWYTWKDFRTAIGEHVVNPLLGESLIRIFYFAKTVKKHGQVVVVIEFLKVGLQLSF